MALGVHLAADRLDDRLADVIVAFQGLLDAKLAGSLQSASLSVGLPDDTLLVWEQIPVVPVAAGMALLVELVADALLGLSFLLTPREPKPGWERWKKALAVRSFVVPLALGGVLLAGSWSMAMAAEDLLPASAVSGPVAWVLGLVVLLRFGWPAFRRALFGLEERPKRRTDGLFPALVLLPVGLLAWLHGVPLWGLLPWGAP